MCREEYGVCGEIKEALKREDAFLNEAQAKTSLVPELAELARRGVPPGGFRVVYEEKREKKEAVGSVRVWRAAGAKWRANGKERVAALAAELEKEWAVTQEKAPEVMVKRKNRLEVLKEKEINH